MQGSQNSDLISVSLFDHILHGDAGITFVGLFAKLCLCFDVELYVAFAHPPRGTPEVSGLTGSVPAAAAWRAAIDVDETGAGCLEVRWRKQEAA